mmetsp:Transcript_28605/g.62947  ORF Transcript_28605/g.62947 Transcript_28605/m.62947 type:complete len:228 (+) Transcript_28605:981-1664(+)
MAHCENFALLRVCQYHGGRSAVGVGRQHRGPIIDGLPAVCVVKRASLQLNDEHAVEAGRAAPTLHHRDVRGTALQVLVGVGVKDEVVADRDHLGIELFCFLEVLEGLPHCRLHLCLLRNTSSRKLGRFLDLNIAPAWTDNQLLWGHMIWLVLIIVLRIGCGTLLQKWAGQKLLGQLCVGLGQLLKPSFVSFLHLLKLVHRDHLGDRWQSSCITWLGLASFHNLDLLP